MEMTPGRRDLFPANEPWTIDRGRWTVVFGLRSTVLGPV